MPDHAHPHPMRGYCIRCRMPIEDLFDHLATSHADQFECWPDGEVVVDESEVLEPEDFL